MASTITFPVIISISALAFPFVFAEILSFEVLPALSICSNSPSLFSFNLNGSSTLVFVSPCLFEAARSDH